MIVAVAIRIVTGKLMKTVRPMVVHWTKLALSVPTYVPRAKCAQWVVDGVLELDPSAVPRTVRCVETTVL